MIQNIIFDMGGVLLRFDPELFMDRNDLIEPDRELIRSNVFRSIEWVQMDRGILRDDEAVQIFKTRLPERLHDAMENLVMHWEDPILPIEGMEELIRQLYENGYSIYLLSNASCRQHDYWSRIPASRYFTDTLISCDLHMIKPQPEIFHAALGKFKISADTSVFIDDMHLNCEGALFAGIQSFVFRQDAEALRKWLQDLGVKI